MSFPDLFKRALALWWRTRALWPLGILAALVGAGDYSGGNNLNFNIPSGNTPGTLPPGVADEWVRNPAVQAFLANPWPLLLGIGVVIVLWSLIAALVGQLAHGAMIRVADQADRGLETGVGDGLRVGVARLLPMFLLSLIVALPALLFAVAIGVIAVGLIAQLAAVGAGGAGSPEAALTAIGGAVLCLVPLGLLAVVLGIALGFFGRVAQRICVVEGRGPIASLGRSWGLVTRNFGNAFLTWLVTLLLGVAFGFASALPALAIALPAAFSFMNSGRIPWAALIALVVYAFAVAVLLGGWLTSFNSTLWTLAYRSFVERDRAFAVPASYAAGD
jgi:hypothetical protein